MTPLTRRLQRRLARRFMAGASMEDLAAVQICGWHRPLLEIEQALRQEAIRRVKKKIKRQAGKTRRAREEEI